MSGYVLHSIAMWFWNAFNSGCCCVSDEDQTEKFNRSDERPVAYASHWEPGPDPMSPARAVVTSPTLRKLKAYYHLSDVGTGVKTGQFDLTAHFVSRYASALNAVAESGWDQFLSLWAHERTGICMEAYAGGAGMRTKQEIHTFMESFPEFSMEMTAVKVAQDELQASCACIFNLRNPPAGVPSKINCVTTFRLNSSGKMVFCRMFWHPSETGGASKTSQYEITAKRIRAFIDALNGQGKDASEDAASLKWICEDGVDVEDPVGTLSRTTKQVVEVYTAGLPPFNAKLKMIRVGQDELQAAAVIEFDFPNNTLLKPFSIIFTFRFQ